MKKFLIAVLSANCLSIGQSLACTAVNIKANDGSVIAGRTMEWALDMNWQLQYVPKNTTFNLTAPANTRLPDVSVTTKFAFIGISTADFSNAFIEGQNEQGLSVSGNFLPGFTQYESVSVNDKNYMSVLQALQFILGSYATVGEVKSKFTEYKVWGDVIKKLGFAPTLHFLITDKTGNSIVIEFIAGKMVVFDNSIGVMTNSPNYDWHLTNVRNYLNLNNSGSFKIPTNSEMDKNSITSLGQGSGGIGLPGDYTSPSRFIKATYLQHYAKSVNSSDEAVQQVAHILNNVDIVNGAVAEENGQHVYNEITQWVVLKDITNNELYIADYKHRTNYAQIDLNPIFKSSIPMKIKLDDISYPSAKLVNPFQGN